MASTSGISAPDWPTTAGAPDSVVVAQPVLVRVSPPAKDTVVAALEVAHGMPQPSKLAK